MQVRILSRRCRLLLQSVSIVIVNYNSSKLLEDTLVGVARQTYKASSTLIVDNASSDKPTKTALHLQNCQVAYLPTNIGFAGANNHGVKLCMESKWVALLNPDAIPAPDWLERLFAAADKYPDVEPASQAAWFSNAVRSTWTGQVTLIIQAVLCGAAVMTYLVRAIT